MAMTVHLTLKANGEDIQGESTQMSLGREDTIECFTFDYGVASASEGFSGAPSGVRNYLPIRITKRIDKSTPRIWQALCENHAIEGTFKFFRPSPAGDGTTEEFYTVEIKEARVAGINFSSPNAMGGAGQSEPPTETIAFVYNNVRQTYEAGGVEFEDSFRDHA
jgi:type VI secretion system secreted protein Hcp